MDTSGGEKKVAGIVRGDKPSWIVAHIPPVFYLWIF